jgi:hypothetical protein
MGEKGVIPRTLTGVTNDGRQVSIILNGLELDHVQHFNFLIWLCRTENFIAYAYCSHMRIIDDGDGIECLDIYASSDQYNVGIVLGIDRQDDGTHTFHDRYRGLKLAGPDKSIFFGMHRADDELPSEDEELFQEIWSELKPRSMWRQLLSS